MKKQLISVIGLGALTNIGCGPIVNTNPPPRDNRSSVEQTVSKSSVLPKWEDVQAPKEGDKAELIVTESGCFKNWVDAEKEPKDRFEEMGKGTKIECPDRAKDITKDEKKELLEPPEPIRRNPPPPQ